jgi:uncharacterized protein UPF0547
MDTSTDKVCPRCAETVRGPARVCRYCGHEFFPKDGRPEPGPKAARSTAPAQLALAVIVVVLVGVAVWTLVPGLAPLSDSQQSWCESHAADVGIQGDALGLPRPKTAQSWTTSHACHAARSAQPRHTRQES